MSYATIYEPWQDNVGQDDIVFPIYPYLQITMNIIQMPKITTKLIKPEFFIYKSVKQLFFKENKQIARVKNYIFELSRVTHRRKDSA